VYIKPNSKARKPLPKKSWGFSNSFSDKARGLDVLFRQKPSSCYCDAFQCQLSLWWWLLTL
jgi:hypothetical protein